MKHIHLTTSTNLMKSLLKILCKMQLFWCKIMLLPVFQTAEQPREVNSLMIASFGKRHRYVYLQ